MCLFLLLKIGMSITGVLCMYRSFYLALWRHAMSIGRKGCYRTALEYCKLILRLDFLYGLSSSWHHLNLFECV